MKLICFYCEDPESQPVKVWKETMEPVCYECRVRLLEEEFDATLKEYTYEVTNTN